MEVQMTKFTLHAFIRVHDRLRLPPTEIADILDSNRCVPIGRDGHRVHRLFYSEPDDYYFVAVQDERNGEVVTILPIDYHNRWKVSHEPLERAKQLMVGGDSEDILKSENAFTAWITEAKEKWEKPEAVPQKPKPSVFVFSAIIESERGRIKTINLGSLPRGEHKTTDDVLRLPETHALIQERLSAAINKSEARCLELTVRLGHSGSPEAFTLKR